MGTIHAHLPITVSILRGLSLPCGKQCDIKVTNCNEITVLRKEKIKMIFERAMYTMSCRFNNPIRGLMSRSNLSVTELSWTEALKTSGAYKLKWVGQT